MPLDKFVLIIVCVLGAAATTVYLGTSLIVRTQLSPFFAFMALGVLALCASITWRTSAERLGNKEADHDDGFGN